MPSARSGLGVRVADGDLAYRGAADRHVTSYVTGLRFRKTAPGGHADASCTVTLPRKTFGNLGPAGKFVIYDSRTAETIFEGTPENPGQTTGDEGETWELSATGAAKRLSERAERLIYVDTTLDQWRKNDFGGWKFAPSGDVETSQFPDGSGGHEGEPALYAHFNSGSPVATAAQVSLIYDAFKNSPMDLGGIHGALDGGMTDSGWWTYITSYSSVTGVDYIVSGRNLSTTVYTVNSFAAASPVLYVSFPRGKDTLVFSLQRSGGATNVATETVWAALGGVIGHTRLAVLGQMQDRYGKPIDMTSFDVLASDVVEDLLGRILTFCDPGAAQIDRTSTLINQLAFLEPTTADAVFEQLYVYEPDFYAGLGASDPDTGLFKFWWRSWNTPPRYEVSIYDGYEAPGGEVDLCNRVAVTWTDQKGVTQTTIRGTHVPDLGNKSPIIDDVGTIDATFKGRIRDADTITLPDGHGSLANAQRAGDLILAAKNAAPKAGTATVDHPIIDMLYSKLVQPWEIEPGYNVAIRETGDVLRMTELEYTHDDGAATLTLGTPVETSDQTIARIGIAQ